MARSQQRLRGGGRRRRTAAVQTQQFLLAGKPYHPEAVATEVAHRRVHHLEHGIDGNAGVDAALPPALSTSRPAALARWLGEQTIPRRPTAGADTSRESRAGWLGNPKGGELLMRLAYASPVRRASQRPATLGFRRPAPSRARSKPYSKASESASQLASIRLVEQPTVLQRW
jgi:hypothetical protein